MTEIIETEPIIAYRAWKIAGGRLNAFGVNCAWPTLKRIEAFCFNGPSFFGEPPPPHNAPLDTCSCGIHGFKNVEALHQVCAANIFGRIALWGTVVETENGYRALYAYPQVLYVPPPGLIGIPFYYSQPDTSDYKMKAAPNPTEEEVRNLADAYGIDTAPMPDSLITEISNARRVMIDGANDLMIAGTGPISIRSGPISIGLGPISIGSGPTYDNYRQSAFERIIGFIRGAYIGKFGKCQDCNHLKGIHMSGCLVENKEGAFCPCDNRNGERP